MPIDFRQETLYPLKIAVKFAPRSARSGGLLHYSVLYRWATKGLGPKGARIYLEVARSNGLVTSKEAIIRFLEKRSQIAAHQEKQSCAAARRDRCEHTKSHAAAARELDAAGI